MNKIRRNEVKEVIELLEAASSCLDTIIMDEQDSFDNLPEGLQYSDRGEQLEENVQDLEDVSSSFIDLIDKLTDIIER